MVKVLTPSAPLSVVKPLTPSVSASDGVSESVAYASPPQTINTAKNATRNGLDIFKVRVSKLVFDTNNF
jgi:hypothetical protein